MAGATLCPFADRSLWFGNAYVGNTMAHPNVLVIHTTEGSSLPDYGGGSLAPTFTVSGVVGKVWQHFPANMSARALVNAAGGVETNTLNVVQVEMIGTCDPSKKGQGMIYWPEATDAQLKPLVDLLKWLHAEWPIPLVSTPKPWLVYPSSYGSAGGQRMSFDEWNNFSGVCGHEHVPENYHGDPGNFPINRLLQLAGGTTQGDNELDTTQAAQLAAVAKVAPLVEALHQGFFYGSSTLGINKGVGALVRDMPTAIWRDTKVERLDADGKKYYVDVIQEVADAKSAGLKSLAMNTTVLQAIQAAKAGDQATLDAIEAAAQEGVKNAIAAITAETTVHVAIAATPTDPAAPAA